MNNFKIVKSDSLLDFRVFLNDVEVGYADYNEYGLRLLESFNSLVRNIAKELGISIEYETEE